MKRTTAIYCPTDAYDCPYFAENGECALDDPLLDCDDFFALECDECYSDKKRTAFEE